MNGRKGGAAVINTLELFRLTGKRAIVTGGGRGIGRAIAIGLASAGADICVAARTEDEIASVAREIVSLGCRAIAVQTDLLDNEAVDRMVHRAEKELGGIDILVNNAGAAPFSADLIDTDLSGWEKYVRLLLNSQVVLMQRLGRRWVDSAQTGAIINVASIFGLRGAPSLSYYSAAKHGLIGVSRSVALELAPHGIRVNVLCPGWVETKLSEPMKPTEGRHTWRLSDVPMGRWARPEEMAAPAVFLASDASSYMTGQVLVVDGGVLA